MNWLNSALKIIALIIFVWLCFILNSFSRTYESQHSYRISIEKPSLKDRYYMAEYRNGVSGVIHTQGVVFDKFTGRFFSFIDGEWHLNTPTENFQGLNADQIQNKIQTGY